MAERHDPFGLLAFLHWNHNWNNFHFNETLLPRAAAQLKELGVGFVRMDILWSDVDSGKGKLDFSRYDKIISTVRDQGIRILGLLHYNKAHEDQNGAEVWNRPPDSLEEFAGYVGSTVGHYKNQIKHWEIWNEPNHPVYWASPKDGLKRYSELLRASFLAAKASDPSCVVLNGGLAEPVVEDVQNLYTQGAHRFFDILAIHTFIDPLSPRPELEFDRIINATRKVMESHGDRDKKIWITEMGCPGLPAANQGQKWFQGDGVTEEQQEQWLEFQYRLARNHPSVEKIFWAFYRDTQDMFHDATDYLGLVRFDLSPKPAFHKFKEIISRYRSETKISK